MMKEEVVAGMTKVMVGVGRWGVEMEEKGWGDWWRLD